MGKNHKLNICLNVTECQSTKRHYTKRNRFDEQQNDNDYNFYINLFDTIHFYIYHLESFGLRVPLKSKEEEKKEEMNDTNNSKFNIMLKTPNQNDVVQHKSEKGDSQNTFI